ncbi:hypothetical protein [Treponema sp.]|uniref:hypothetical protein n=1 Tax=Treponema sp. TaxID=166 RepID=UPI00388EF036
MKFLFKEDKNTMVITTSNIINKTDIITTVYHDSDDGMWQFLGKIQIDETNAVLVSLEEICMIDESVNELYQMPCGYMAYREIDLWKVSKYS